MKYYILKLYQTLKVAIILMKPSRKVVQYAYNGCGDTGDEYAGHGTHVAGTAIGSIANANFSSGTKYMILNKLHV
jgi:subtilisin family serine protease